MYSKNGYILYQTLESIYHLKKKNLNYGFSLFRQLCNPFDIKIIKTYIKFKYGKYIQSKNNRFYFKNNYINEITMVKLGYAHIRIKSNIILPKVLKIFEFYNQKIFVCDFKNKDFFWLSKQYK